MRLFINKLLEDDKMLDGDIRLYEIMRFCVVGGLTFIIDYGLLYFFTKGLSINYLFSAAVSFIIAVIINYFLCVKYVFVDAHSQTMRQTILFIGSSVVGLGINQVCMWMLVEKFGLYFMIAKIIATILVTIWNYIMKRKAVTC